MHKFSHFHLCEHPLIVSDEIPGVQSRRLLDLQTKLEGSIVSYPRNIPIAIKRAKGAIIEDVDGNYYLDFFAGAGVVNLGHCNEEVLAYAEKQQKELIHALDFPTENKLNAIQKILAHLPVTLRDEYKVSFVGPTGSDAIEAAIKLAKIKTRRDTVIAFSGGYHGMSATALALTSDTGFRQGISSLVPNIHFVPYPYCYRCVFKKNPDNCALDCLGYLKMVLEDGHSGIPKPAAIILEPVQGEGGNIKPKAGYLEALVELAHKHDVLVIFDEVQSGFFRSGEFLSFMHGKAIPDIITVSKGLGGVGFPVAGIIYKRDIEAWGPAAHIGTFRGNQVSLAAANGAFDFVDKYDLNEHTQAMSKLLFAGLDKLKAVSPLIGEVRGEGLMIGIEFVKSRESREPDARSVKEFRKNCLHRGLIFEVGGHFNNVVRLVPPLIITPAIIAAALEIMEDSLAAMKNNLTEILLHHQ